MVHVERETVHVGRETTLILGAGPGFWYETVGSSHFKKQEIGASVISYTDLLLRTET